MLYIHEARAKKLADIKVNNIKQAQKIAPAVIEVLEKYKGKSITGNKKRIKEAIESINKALYVVIEHDMFEHVKLRYSCVSCSFQAVSSLETPLRISSGSSPA